MNIAVEAKPVTDIITLVTLTPTLVLDDPVQLEKLYAKIKTDMAAHKPDMSTKTSRGETTSFAFKLTKTRTAVVKAAKEKNEEANRQIKAVNAVKNSIEEKLLGWEAEIKRPVTEWEAAEDDRLAAVKDEMTRLRSAGIVAQHETSADIAARMAKLQAETFDRAVFQDEWDDVDRLKQMANVALGEIYYRVLTQENEKAELERLRQAEVERLRVEAEKAEADRLAAKVKADAEAAEARRIEAAKAEEERIAAAAKRAQDEATTAAERKAREDRETLEAKHRAELKAEQDKAAAAEAKRQEEAARIARQKADQDAEAKRQADADAKRAASVAHRTKIKTGIKKAVMALGADEELAIKFVTAAVLGKIPGVVVQF